MYISSHPGYNTETSDLIIKCFGLAHPLTYRKSVSTLSFIDKFMHVFEEIESIYIFVNK